MKIAALIVGGLAQLLSLPVAYLLFVMWSMFTGSHVSTDKQLGWLALCLLPVSVLGPSLCLWWVGWHQGWRFWTGFGLGGALLLLYGLLCIVLPGGLEAAARP